MSQDSSRRHASWNRIHVSEMVSYSRSEIERLEPCYYSRWGGPRNPGKFGLLKSALFGRAAPTSFDDLRSRVVVVRGGERTAGDSGRASAALPNRGADLRGRGRLGNRDGTELGHAALQRPSPAATVDPVRSQPRAEPTARASNAAERAMRLAGSEGNEARVHSIRGQLETYKSGNAFRDNRYLGR